MSYVSRGLEKTVNSPWRCPMSLDPVATLVTGVSYWGKADRESKRVFFFNINHTTIKIYMTYFQHRMDNL